MSSKKVKPARRRWKPTPGAKLGPQEVKIVKALEGGGFRSVTTLFKFVVGKDWTRKWHNVGHRQMQQRVGAIVARLNKKLKGRRVVAGELPGTYRLRRVR